MKPEIASRRDRVRAGVIDGFLFLPLIVIDYQVASLGWSVGPVLAYFLVSWQLGWVYTVVLHGWRGQTVGKMVHGIRVVRHTDRGRLGWVRSAIRESPYILMVLAGSNVWAAWMLAPLVDLESDDLDAWATAVLDNLYYVNLGWVGLEFVTMAIHPERRAIHDFLAGSVVVRVARPADAVGEPNPGPADKAECG